MAWPVSRFAGRMGMRIIEESATAGMIPADLPGRMWAASGGKVTGVMGEGLRLAMTRMGASVAGGEEARRAAMAAVKNMSAAERRVFKREQIKRTIAGTAALAPLGIASAVPFAAGAAAVGAMGERRKRLGYLGPIATEGYPGTTYNPPADLGADGDLVFAAHNVHGTGRNRGMR